MIGREEAFAHLSTISDEQLLAAWIPGGTLDDVARKLREQVGRPVPRWWVLSRAATLRRMGNLLDPLADEPQRNTPCP